jgi:hypothetical protein
LSIATDSVDRRGAGCAAARGGYRSLMGAIGSAGPGRALALALCGALLAASCGGCGSISSNSSTPSNPPPAHGLEGGIKGEGPGEQQSNLHLDAGDCAKLALALEGGLGVALRKSSDPSPPLSQCHLRGPGVDVNVYLDTARAAHQRYENRMVEQSQFGAPDPAKLPHPVAAVGERSAYNRAASWVPAYDTLFAVRGRRWLTVAYSREGVPSPRLLPEAAQLARQAFRLSAP